MTPRRSAQAIDAEQAHKRYDRERAKRAGRASARSLRRRQRDAKIDAVLGPVEGDDDEVG